MKVKEEMREEVKFILEVMSFRHLKLLVGAYDFLYSNQEKWLQFKFYGYEDSNICKITYDIGRDTFNMEFILFDEKTSEVSSKEEIVDLFAEDLVRVFEETTGLFIRFTN